MEFIDVLGERPDRRSAFTKELLSEAHDVELQQIVQDAAQELSVPIALVSLVLDHIQFFRAHYGLPPDLAAARGTRRDVSFCQFVVRDEDFFEVTNAPEDERIPQFVVTEYGVKSYLGAPVRVDDTVVGSLCVLDTEPHAFTQQDKEHLQALAQRVEARLESLARVRLKTRVALAEPATASALSELQEALTSIQDGASAALSSVAALRTQVRMTAHVLEGKPASPHAMRSILASAKDALTACEDTLVEIESTAADSMDCVSALDRMTTRGPVPTLSEVLFAAQDLARPSTRTIGSVPLPDLTWDPVLSTPRSLAVSLVTAALMSVAGRLAQVGYRDGMQMFVHQHDHHARLVVKASALDADTTASIATHLGIDDEPTVSVSSGSGQLIFDFTLPEG